MTPPTPGSSATDSYSRASGYEVGSETFVQIPPENSHVPPIQAGSSLPGGGAEYPPNRRAPSAAVSDVITAPATVGGARPTVVVTLVHRLPLNSHVSPRATSSVPPPNSTTSPSEGSEAIAGEGTPAR